MKKQMLALFGTEKVGLNLNNTLKRTTIFFVFSLVVPLAWGADLNVSPTGDDLAGDGSAEHPYRTLTKALSLVDSGSDVVLAAGDYGADETFPLSVPSGVRVRAAGGRALVDAENSSANVFLFSGTEGSGLSNLVVRGSTEAAVRVAEGSTNVVLSSCWLTQDHGQVWKTNMDGALSVWNKSYVTLEDCEISCITTRTWVVRFGDETYSSITMNRCLVDRNNVSTDKGNNDASVKCSVIYGKKGSLKLYDCTFSRNVAPNKVPHDAACSAVAYLENFTMTADRCKFVGNHGGAIFGVCGSGDNENIEICNSLLADNVGEQAMIMGYNAATIFRACTLVRNNGGYTTYSAIAKFFNSIFVDEGKLSRQATYNNRASNPNKLYLCNTVLWNCDSGDGYNTGSSQVLTYDPQLECVSIPWDDESFDPRPRPQSPVLDAGAPRADRMKGAFDLNGNVRVLDNDDDGEAVIDLGCCESAFHAASVPTFSVPLPGAFYAFRGETLEIPVLIAPAAAVDTVAVVTYGPGLSGPATITIPAGSSGVTLEVATSGETPSASRIWFEDAAGAVVSADFDIYASSIEFTVGGMTQFYTAPGREHEIGVRLAAVGLTSPKQVEITVGTPSGAGAGTFTWVGSSTVEAGAVAADGHLAVIGGHGRKEVTLTLSAGQFVETGTSSVTIYVFGHDGAVVLDPANGEDAFGNGDAGHPFRTLAYALTATFDGDEIRLVPGSYGKGDFAFPVELGGRRLVGWNPSGEADPADFVIDGGDVSGINLFLFKNAQGGGLANLSLRNTKDMSLAKFVAANAVVSNCVFTQKTTNRKASGGVEATDVSTLELVDCVFTNITRFGAVFVSGQDDTSSVTARRCRFARNSSGFGTLCGEFDKEGGTHNSKPSFYITDCIFERNSAASNYKIGDTYPCSCVAVRNGGRIELNRCKVLGGGSTGCTIGVSGRTTVKIANTLFAGNASSQGLFCGYNSDLSAQNCTFVDNGGGFACYALRTKLYNCIVLDEGTLNFVNEFGNNDSRELHLYRSIVWNTDLGTGIKADSTPIEENPMLKKADVAWDDPAFNVMPTDGPAIDAGNNDYTTALWADFGTLDVNGESRFQAGYARNRQDPIVDLGCCESGFCRKGMMIYFR